MADAEVVKAAIDAVARQAIANAAHELEWGLYPEIGEYDWLNVVARAEKVLTSIRPPADEFKAAYEVLESRAAPEKPGRRDQAAGLSEQPRGEAAYWLEGDDEIFTEAEHD